MKDINEGPRHAKAVQLTKEDREVVDGESNFKVKH